MDENSEQPQSPLIRPVRPVPQEEEKRKMRIKIWMGWSLIITALFIDVVELMLEWFGIGIFGLSTLISVGATVLFWVWFQMLGVPYSSNTKRFFASIIQAVVELFPGLDGTIVFSFMWTGGMIVIVGMVRMEDKGEAPSIIGGIREGLGFVTSTNILAPIAMPIGAAIMATNKARRFVKNKAGIGQADWVKQNTPIKNMTNAVKFVRNGDDKKTHGENNVLNLKKDAAQLKKAA